MIPSGVDEFATWKSVVSLPRSPRSHILKGKRIIREALSPLHKKDFDSFAAAIEQAHKGLEHGRGRERFFGSNFGCRGVSTFAWEEKEQQQSTKSASSNSKSSSTSSSSLKGSKKWRLKDFLLFQRASEVHVAGFAPAPTPATDCGGGGMRWKNGSELKKKRLKEQDFLENNSQISSVDFLQTRSVSTGLGLSLDDRRMASSGDSPLFSLLDDDIDGELQRQEAEMDRFVKVHVCLCIRFFPNPQASGQPTAPVRGEEGQFQLTSCVTR
ncbi:PREDICTED: uncharacterized protein LOC104610044 [Nelumbo nucifera]|uniref:Uncharacterized protein LOC104610044 n=2 Tax=Nelumbo nucifera TaxID=4432 RepID=A0A1U8B275_NELNU|nr:PREDICTED: uncharacterized protein LOC104610044 [Nelumbo nucifera]DAD19856.1 TPA_asm: hypothetical protein HUJ06_021319 [Nelumbo nucifera]